MSFDITVSGAAAEAVSRVVPQLVSDLVASRITAQDPTLWGKDAEDEASRRLGWTEAVVVSEGLVDDILTLRDDLRASGITRVVLGGMGGSSLAPEVIARTAGVELTVLDSTDPGQVRATLADRIESSVLVTSSKSGSTVETDSQLRVFVAAFTAAGIDPVERIVVVTDPGSPLDESARRAGYRVFNADPNVGGRYSALTAFGLVPAGLAGVDIAALLDEASAVSGRLAVDHRDNPGLILGAAIAGTRPLKDKLGIVTDGSHIVGFGDWVEQLVAESTGKQGTGILPVVLQPDSPELAVGLDDLQVVRLVASAKETLEVIEGEIEVSGTLGAQLLVWEYATVVAGRLLGINPFDQPDVESAKVATRALLEGRPTVTTPHETATGIRISAHGLPEQATHTVEAAVAALLAAVEPDGYVAIHAYADRMADTELERLRDAIASACGRPVTFGWGPRFLHSTGQFHKGGPAVGVFLQLTTAITDDLEVPGRPFTFGQLIHAQAAGDAAVLAQHGRPVLTLELTDPATATDIICSAISA